MSSEAREELAQFVYLSNYGDPTSDRIQPLAERSQWEQEGVYWAADAIIAAGYFKPRTITTVEELDALPDGSFIVTEQGGYWQAYKRGHGINWWHEPNSRGASGSEDLTLPATVLWEPEA